MLFKKKKKDSRSPQLKPAIRNVQVNNYYRSPRSAAKPTVIDSENKPDKKKNFSFSKFVNFLLFGGAVGLVVFATTLTTYPVIELKKDSANYYDATVYASEAQKIIESNILNRSKLLFQESSFEQQMKKKFPEISQARPVSPIGGRRPTVVITVSDPFAYVSSGSDTGIVNNEGVLVAKNSQTNSEDLLKLRFAEPQTNFDVGSRILTSSEVDLLSKLQAEMRKLEFADKSTGHITEALFNVASGQIEASIVQKPFLVKLSTFTDSDIQVGGAVATLRQLDRENTLPARYIDVRVPGRAFVL
jgi:hypothetical protein